MILPRRPKVMDLISTLDSHLLFSVHCLGVTTQKLTNYFVMSYFHKIDVSFGLKLLICFLSSQHISVITNHVNSSYSQQVIYSPKARSYTCQRASSPRKNYTNINCVSLSHTLYLLYLFSLLFAKQTPGRTRL